jgi:DNA-binding IclR family transcriptional regulator
VSSDSVSGRQPKAIQSALRVLEAVASSGPGVTAKQLARALDLPSATTYRLLNILVADGYLVRLPDLQGFALGRRIGGLLGSAPTQIVCHAAHQRVAELRSGSRFATHLVHYTPTGVLVVDADPDHGTLSGQVLSHALHASAIGKLLLADQTEWRDLFPVSRVVALTEDTITSAKALDEELRACRSAGIAHQIGELRPDIACLAVPVRSVSGVLVGALAISGPRDRYQAFAPSVEAMRKCAADLGPLLA